MTSFYIEVAGDPSCQSNVTLANAFREKPTRCGWATREEAQTEADRIAALAKVVCRVVEGRCPRGGPEDDYFGDDRYTD